MTGRSQPGSGSANVEGQPQRGRLIANLTMTTRRLQMWVGAVEIKPVSRKAGSGLARVEFEAQKVVAPEVGPRLFLDRTPRLPCDTPAGLRELRDRELNIIQVRTFTIRELSRRIRDGRPPRAPLRQGQ